MKNTRNEWLTSISVREKSRRAWLDRLPSRDGKPVRNIHEKQKLAKLICEAYELLSK